MRMIYDSEQTIENFLPEMRKYGYKRYSKSQVTLTLPENINQKQKKDKHRRKRRMWVRAEHTHTPTNKHSISNDMGADGSFSHHHHGIRDNHSRLCHRCTQIGSCTHPKTLELKNLLSCIPAHDLI